MCLYTNARHFHGHPAGSKERPTMCAARDGYSSMKGGSMQVCGCDEEKLYMTSDGISSGTLCSQSVRICGD